MTPDEEDRRRAMLKSPDDLPPVTLPACDANAMYQRIAGVCFDIQKIARQTRGDGPEHVLGVLHAVIIGTITVCLPPGADQHVLTELGRGVAKGVAKGLADIRVKNLGKLAETVQRPTTG